MCTLTVTPVRDGHIVAMNRDEHRSRKPCSGIRETQANGITFLYPEDGEKRGTWIAVNDRGWVFALTNYYPGGQILLGSRSRGEIVLALTPHSDRQQIDNALTTLVIPDKPSLQLPTGTTEFGAFRLLIVSPAGEISIHTWDTHHLTVDHQPAGFFFLTSAAFINEEGATHRRHLFNELEEEMKKAEGEARIPMIRSYHLTHDPNDPASSVCMERPEAKTFSYTEIAVRSEAIELRHIDDPLRMAQNHEQAAFELMSSLTRLTRRKSGH